MTEVQPKKILLLGAGFTTNNMGVWALASGAMTAIWHVYPDAQISLFDYHAAPDNYKVRHPGGVGNAHLVNIRFSKKFWMPNNIARLVVAAFFLRAIYPHSLRDRFIANNFWLSCIKEADIIGSIAGGDSFGDIYGFWRLIYVSLPQILVLLLKKPLILLPQTIGPFKRRSSKIVASYILRNARMIYSRDHQGMGSAGELLDREGSRLKFCYDLGFVLEPYIENSRKPEWLIKRDSRLELIGINISGLLYIGGYSRQNMFGLKGDYRKLIRDLIDFFVSKQNAEVVLVPHVFGEGENSESDVTACRNIFQELGGELQNRVHLLERNYDQHEMKALIGYCDFFLGSRMHACIAALSQCIPAVGLAYSRKFKGVFNSLDIEDTVIDLRESDATSVVEAVDRSYKRRLLLRDRLQDAVPKARMAVMSLFNSESIKPGD